MRRDIGRTLAVALAVVALAGTAQAQGKSHGHGRGDDHGDAYGDDRSVPPGLAKKPGQMPPGQFKKRYGTADGAWVLRDVLRRRGYVVTRLATVGDARTVYYRASDGTLRRALVRPGGDRLAFGNVPAVVLQEVLARLR